MAGLVDDVSSPLFFVFFWADVGVSAGIVQW